MRKLIVKQGFLLIGLIFIYFVVTKSCSFHTLPKENLSASKIHIDESYEDGEYQLLIQNLVDCPMRFFLSSQEEEVNELLKTHAPILLGAKGNKRITIQDKGDLKGQLNFKVKWGNPELAVTLTKIKKLPYPKGKSYKLLQGNNSTPTHNTILARYAFDFTLDIGDTITAVQDGYVVEAVDGYKGWGMSDKWKPFGNQIMVYDTISHLFTMYGHLKQHGSLVEVGDYVKSGQSIALSGKTGQTTEAHLHFNIFQADRGKKGLKSYPLDSIGRYKIQELKRGQWMKN